MNEETDSKRIPDPFFSGTEDSEWNACIGRQGSEENYLDGYIDAALELTSAILSNKLYAKRDTLAMPILYNARHAIELTLKFVEKKLLATGITKSSPSKNHDIKNYLEHIKASNHQDPEISRLLEDLSPFVSSLTAIDEDGQELRYHENRSGKKSMSELSLMNIRTVETSLQDLREILSKLQFRIMFVENERRTKSYTIKFSREALYKLAQRLPKRKEWGEEVFSNCKKEIIEEFGLSMNQFSQALDIIKKQREMKLLIGEHSKLISITDTKAELFIEEWLKNHPQKKEDYAIGREFSDQDFDELREAHQTMLSSIALLTKQISYAEISDIDTIFQMGSANTYVEYYEADYKDALNEKTLSGDIEASIKYLLEKTNFKEDFCKGIAILGRPDLAKHLTSLN